MMDLERFELIKRTLTVSVVRILMSDYGWSEEKALSNTSLRERFGLEKTNSNTVLISNLIKQAKNANLVKVVDENTSTRLLKYLPYWA